MRLSAVATALLASKATAYPYKFDCSDDLSGTFTAMAGTWLKTTNSADITNVGTTVTISNIPSNAGLFVRSSAGILSTTSFTTKTLEHSECATATNVIASDVVDVSPTVVVEVDGLWTGNCAAVDIFLVENSGYSGAGSIVTNTLNLCTGDLPNSTTTTTATTTVAAATTTTTGGDGDDSFDAYQFQSNDDGTGVNAYWYVQGNNFHLFFDKTLSSTSQQFVGFGFMDSDSTTEQYYVGETVGLTVSSYTDGTGGLASTADSRVSDSGCELQDNTLFCYVVRTIDDLSADQTLLWAFGDTDASGVPSAGEPQSSNQGTSDDTHIVVDSAPELPSIEIEGVLDAEWSATPAGNVDIFMSAISNGDGGWVGVGFGEGDSGMGPGQFYVGQAGNDPAVQDMYLSSSSGRPSARSSQDLSRSECNDDGERLNCSFTRPLALTASDAVSLVNDVYIRASHGPGTSSQINKHGTDTLVTGSAVGLYSIEAADIGAAESNPALYKAHGILMTIAWLFLLPYGIYVARFRSAVSMAEKPKDGPPMWFAIHQPLQYIGVILFIIGLILILVEFQGSFSVGAHSMIGIITIVLALCQPTFAFFRNGCNETDKEKIDKCHHAWHIIHAICGYLALVLAIVAVFLGFVAFRGSSEDIPSLFLAGYIVGVASLVIFVIAAIAIQIGAAKAKAKHSDAEAQTEKSSEGEKANNYSWVAWVFFGLLLIGAVLCSVQIGLDDSRD